ncbi:MAG: DUF1707 domain-containing protein [Streptosporangiales bacterium]|nr:DUF1707 domain-containing protein [Streptosporangiales bacterium]
MAGHDVERGRGDDTRASDADRERVVESLREQTAIGRLTLEELDERSGAAYAARTWADLRPLLADLPVRVRFDGEPALPTGDRRAPWRRMRQGWGPPGPRWFPFFPVVPLALFAAFALEGGFPGPLLVLMGFFVIRGFLVLRPW